jgi:hypothetical protein
MTIWPGMPDARFVGEVYEARLKQAEQERKIRALPRRATLPLWKRALALLLDKAAHEAAQKPVLYQELKA